MAPWWESSKEGVELMLRYGLEYDHSFSHHDCQVCDYPVDDDVRDCVKTDAIIVLLASYR